MRVSGRRGLAVIASCFLRGVHFSLDCGKFTPVCWARIFRNHAITSSFREFQRGHWSIWRTILSSSSLRWRSRHRCGAPPNSPDFRGDGRMNFFIGIGEFLEKFFSLAEAGKLDSHFLFGPARKTDQGFCEFENEHGASPSSKSTRGPRDCRSQTPAAQVKRPRAWS